MWGWRGEGWWKPHQCLSKESKQGAERPLKDRHAPVARARLHWLRQKLEASQRRESTWHRHDSWQVDHRGLTSTKLSRYRYKTHARQICYDGFAAGQKWSTRIVIISQLIGAIGSWFQWSRCQRTLTQVIRHWYCRRYADVRSSLLGVNRWNSSQCLPVIHSRNLRMGLFRKKECRFQE